MKFLQKLFRRNKKGQQAGAVSAIIGAFIVGAIILLFLWVNSTFKGSIDRTGFTAAENTTYEKVTTNVDQGFRLGSVLPVVLVVMAIVGAIFIVARSAGGV